MYYYVQQKNYKITLILIQHNTQSENLNRRNSLMFMGFNRIGPLLGLYCYFVIILWYFILFLVWNIFFKNHKIAKHQILHAVKMSNWIGFGPFGSVNNLQYCIVFAFYNRIIWDFLLFGIRFDFIFFWYSHYEMILISICLGKKEKWHNYPYFYQFHFSIVIGIEGGRYFFIVEVCF